MEEVNYDISDEGKKIIIRGDPSDAVTAKLEFCMYNASFFLCLINENEKPFYRLEITRIVKLTWG